MSQNVTIATHEYFYCKNCKTVRYAFELKSTPDGVHCSTCGGHAFDPPIWVYCPHRKGAVKCPIGGRRLVKKKRSYECLDRCKSLMKCRKDQTHPK